MCDRCNGFKKSHPEYSFCPCCGQDFQSEVKEAVNKLIDYCTGRKECRGCSFYLSNGDACFFCDMPINWEKY